MIHKSKPYYGYILESTEQQPFYYWFFLEDKELIKLYGDSISFRLENNELIPAHSYLNNEFVEIVKRAIIRYINRKCSVHAGNDS